MRARKEMGFDLKYKLEFFNSTAQPYENFVNRRQIVVRMSIARILIVPLVRPSNHPQIVSFGDSMNRSL